MSNASDNSSETDVECVGLERPRARVWMWHPWYAKAWWLGMTAYWSGKAASFSLPSLDPFYTSAPAGFLNIFFFPPTISLILGLGFARAWLASSNWVFDAPTDEQMFRRRGIGGLRDPASDPLDPRSGMLHWKHFHPDL